MPIKSKRLLKAASIVASLTVMLGGSLVATPAFAAEAFPVETITENSNGTFTCSWDYAGKAYELSDNSPSSMDCSDQFFLAQRNLDRAEQYRDSIPATDFNKQLVIIDNADGSRDLKYRTGIVIHGMADAVEYKVGAALDAVLTDELARLDAATPVEDPEIPTTPEEPSTPVSPEGVCFTDPATEEQNCEAFPVTDWLSQTSSNFPEPSTAVPVKFACSGGCYGEAGNAQQIQKPSMVIAESTTATGEWITYDPTSHAAIPYEVSIPLDLSNYGGWKNLTVLGAETTVVPHAFWMTKNPTLDNLYAGETSELNATVPARTYVQTDLDSTGGFIPAGETLGSTLKVTVPAATFTRTTDGVLNAWGVEFVSRVFLNADNGDGKTYTLAAEIFYSASTPHATDIEDFVFESCSNLTTCSQSESYSLESVAIYSSVATMGVQDPTVPPTQERVSTHGVCKIQTVKEDGDNLVVTARLDVFGQDQIDDPQYALPYDLPTELAQISLTDNTKATTEVQEIWKLITTDWMKSKKPLSEAPPLTGIGNAGGITTPEIAYFTGVNETFTFADTSLDESGNRNLTLTYSVVVRGGGEGYLMDVPCSLATVVPPAEDPKPPVVPPVDPPVEDPKPPVVGDPIPPVVPPVDPPTSDPKPPVVPPVDPPVDEPLPPVVGDPVPPVAPPADDPQPAVEEPNPPVDTPVAPPVENPQTPTDEPVVEPPAETPPVVDPPAVVPPLVPLVEEPLPPVVQAPESPEAPATPDVPATKTPDSLAHTGFDGSNALGFGGLILAAGMVLMLATRLKSRKA
jgi:hypothetical protein